MARALQITSPANPRLKQLARLREHRHRRKTGQFIAEGHREVARALAAGLTIRELWTAPELLAASAAPDLDVRDSAQRLEVPARLFRKIAYVREPEGILAVVDQPRWTFDGLPPVTDQTLYLVAVGLEKPGNLGAIVRSADAAGCQAVFAASAPVDVFNPNAIRTSTGAVFAMPVINMTEAETRDQLHAAGVRMALATLRHATPHTDFDWQGPTAIVIGPEDAGLNDAWHRHPAAHRVRIDMRGRIVDSLNASNAAAVLMFEARRHMPE